MNNKTSSLTKTAHSVSTTDLEHNQGERRSVGIFTQMDQANESNQILTRAIYIALGISGLLLPVGQVVYRMCSF